MTHGAAALVVKLLFTLPSTNAMYVDSTAYYCQGGAPLEDLSEVRIYGWPASGGPARVVARQDVRGRQGAPDTVSVEPWPAGGHYWVAAVDVTGNEGCVSDVVYSGPVTAVEDIPVDTIVETLVFDVHGRRIRAPSASGVYWTVTRWASGRVVKKKLVVLK